MFKIRFNEQRSFLINTVFGIDLILLSLGILCLPAYAGAQSLLDPYSEVSPTQESKPLSKKAARQLVKQPIRQAEPSLEETSIGNNEANKDLSSNTDVSDKTSRSQDVNSKINKGDGSGFLSGIKEVERGSVASIKAAGGGIIGGSKVAGSKVAAGTKAIGGGIATASQKIVSGSKTLTAHVIPAKKEKKDTSKIAKANAMPPSGSHTILPPLPGKPLDQVIAEEKERKRLKDVAVTEEVKKRKPGIITSAVGKIKFLHKAKKQVPDNLTANNSSAAAR